MGAEKAIVEDEDGAFFFAHTTIVVGFGLPLYYLLSVIGQFSSLGTLGAWKLVPASRGIGLGIAASMAIMAVLNSVTVAHAIYYLILAFHRVIGNYSAD